MKTRIYNVLAVALLAGCGVAFAATVFTQVGPHSENRPTMGALQLEQRNAGNSGWQAVSVGTSAGQLAAGNDSRFTGAVALSRLPAAVQNANDLTSGAQSQLDNKQPLSSGLITLSGLTPTSGNVITGNGSAWTSQAAQLNPLFVSGRLTGNGSAQNTAHGLGVLPRLCWVSVAKLPALAGILTLAATLYTPGTHTSTNCVFTVLSGADYYVMAAT